VFAFILPVYRPLFHQPLHELTYQNFQDLVTGSAKEATWIAYRESANTIARKQVIDALRHNGKDVSTCGDRLYLNVGSYDKANAESVLFDVVT